MSEVQVSLGLNRYGKGDVRILRIIRDTPKHEVYEIKARILLEGDFDETFTTGSNKKIVATETQKNTLYVYAKKFAVHPIEEWAINVSKAFMERYSHIRAVNMKVEQQPWERVQVAGKPHNHVFQRGSGGIRFCKMRLSNKGQLSLTSGFKDLQIMKTTQSGFEGYIKDEFTTLPETKDRVMCTKIKCVWTYTDAGNGWCGLKNGCYNSLYNDIVQTNINIFAGDAEKGAYSPSVQQTVYEIGKEVIRKHSSVEKVSFVLPNIHYYYVDFKQFKTDLTNKNEVYFTFDGAHGYIEGTVQRSANKSKL